MSEMLDHPVVRHRIDRDLLLSGKSEGGETEVQGFRLSDAASLMLNYLEQSTNEELLAIKAEAEGVTTTNCWYMSYAIAPSVVYLAESIIQDRDLQPPTSPTQP